MAGRIEGERLMSIRDTSEAKRVYGGGVAMNPMGVSSPESAMPSDEKVTPSDDELLLDSMSTGKKSTSQRVLRPPSSKTTTVGPTPPPPKLDSLDDFYNKQVKEYVPVAKKVLSKTDFRDFEDDLDAQIDFSEAASAKSFTNKLNSDISMSTENRTLNDGTNIQVIVVGDGSEFYVDDGADLDDLQPGDVIRLKPPEKRYR